MRDWGWLSAPFLGFAGLEQVGELFDGEDALLLILSHHPGRDAIEQAKVVLLLGLRSARALKGAERTMLIQNKASITASATFGYSASPDNVTVALQ